ncbi:flavoprotein [Xylariaceae sp. FL0255]|nr:flavoprotein [Xylariaceae sp. FL0255]
MSDYDWNEQTEVAIIGGGLAGMCAAIAAAENGASVTVLDRGYGGGSSAISAGVIYAGGGTKQQLEPGFKDDTPDNMYRYLEREVGDAVDEATLRRFCNESVDRMEWLEAHGVQFEGSFCPFKTSLPTTEHFLYFSGNEKALPFRKLAIPAPRGHRPVGSEKSRQKGMGLTGADLWQTIFNSALRLGVRFVSASKVDEIITSEGRIEGVHYYSMDAGPWLSKLHQYLVRTALSCQATIQPLANLLDYLADGIWARYSRERVLKSRTVILATGGFIMNKNLIKKFIPQAGGTTPLGTIGDDGSGILLGQSVGGSVSHMDRFSAWRLIYPPEALVEGVIVSLQGDRIAAEDLYGGSFTDVMVRQSNSQGFLILDASQWTKAKCQLEHQTRGLWKTFIQYLLIWGHKKANTLQGLARKMGINELALEKTVRGYNDAIIHEKEDPMGKQDHRTAITTAPFYGIDVSLGQTGFLMTPALTLGGLRVDGGTGHVLDDSGNIIRGLYAAGRNAVGVCSNSYISGLSLADGVFSGKRAGEEAARESKIL